jgi:hypothetical protein
VPPTNPNSLRSLNIDVLSPSGRISTIILMNKTAIQINLFNIAFLYANAKIAIVVNYVVKIDRELDASNSTKIE